LNEYKFKKKIKYNKQAIDIYSRRNSHKYTKNKTKNTRENSKKIDGYALCPRR